MNVLQRWRRSAIALAAAAAAVPLATSPASAAPVRTATTTDYTHATFLQHALGLPATNTNPVIESVTYDRFQWLLQQPGKFAVLIGDPATDPSFDDRAQDVEAAANAAGAKKVYWFNPNLSGSAKVGSSTEPTLDIRRSGDIPLPSASQTKYGNAWLNLVGQYLGNGYTATVNSPYGESATVTAAQSTNANDAGATAGSSTKVGNTSGGALYDYSTATPANASHSVFFVYDKDNTLAGQAEKIVSWVDLNEKATSGAAKDDVTEAIAKVGAANLTQRDQFAWWKDEGAKKQVFQGSTFARGNTVPLLTDADNADGWRIDQITYPELVDLFKSGANTANAVILFGGTWCPNTRPVLPAINKYAQENNVRVFNFDTVLDGGVAGGGTTSSENPLQVRNIVNKTTNPQIANANPTSLYGDLVTQYLANNNTEYTTTGTGASPVTYYKGGDTATPVTSAKKLQVPFLIGYKGKAGDEPNDGVTRQWIIDNGNGTYKEYMSNWWFTNPQPNQLDLSPTQLPQAAPVWATLNAQVANFKWDTDVKSVIPNTGIDSDDGPYLTPTETATVTFNGAGTDVSAAAGGANPIPVTAAALSEALTTLGAAAPVNLAAAKAALLAAKAANQDLTTLSTVFGAYTLGNARKRNVLNRWGSQTSPNTIAGGIAAVHAVEVFFGGLPGGVVSRRTVTAEPVPFGTAPKVSISIANDYGRVPAGNLSLVVKKAGATVASASTAVADNAASFTLPVLDAGTYDYALSYPGDDQIAGFTEAGSLTVEPVQNVVVDPPVTTPVVIAAPGSKPPSTTVTLLKASKVKGAVSKAPTSKKAGKYKVTITTPKGASAASGKVTIKLKKGKTTKTITGKLSKGVVTFSVPKLARGTWKVAISWPGDSKYLAASATGASIRVTK